MVFYCEKVEGEKKCKDRNLYISCFKADDK